MVLNRNDRLSYETEELLNKMDNGKVETFL